MVFVGLTGLPSWSTIAPAGATYSFPPPGLSISVIDISVIDVVEAKWNDMPSDIGSEKGANDGRRGHTGCARNVCARVSSHRRRARLPPRTARTRA